MRHHLRTWAEIDLDALGRNLRTIRAAAGPEVGVCLVCKADAYGHGAVQVAWRMLEEGVACLGVGDSTEALELRHAGITAPILILGTVVPGELEAVLRGGIGITVHSGDRVRLLRRVVQPDGAHVPLHLKVDTGMGRLGCQPERALDIARAIRESPGLELEGVATHLASTEPGGGAGALAQVTRFRDVVEDLRTHDLLPRWRHAYASGAILSKLPGLFNMIRPGLSVYGIDPHGRPDAKLTPALSWRTQVVFLKDHLPGSPVGYQGTWTATSPSRIATLPVGYNDGYRFAFSNRAEVLVRGTRCPVVGRVSMDYVCIDVTNVEGASVGDVATLLGTDGSETIRAEELARVAETIPYEILCGIGRRVRRRHVRSSSSEPATTMEETRSDL